MISRLCITSGRLAKGFHEGGTVRVRSTTSCDDDTVVSHYQRPLLQLVQHLGTVSLESLLA